MLMNVGYLVAMRPQFLPDLLGKFYSITSLTTVLIWIVVFARRCAPGSGYSLPMLKEAVGNAIRCARHKLKKSNVHLIAASSLRDNEELYGNNVMTETLSQDDERFWSSDLLIFYVFLFHSLSIGCARELFYHSRSLDPSNLSYDSCTKFVRLM